MDKTLILAIVATAAVFCGGFIIYLLFVGKRSSNLDALMQASRTGESGAVGKTREMLQSDEGEAGYEKLKELQRKAVRKKTGKITEEMRYFQAGFLTDKEQQRFKMIRIFSPVAAGVIFSFLTWYLLGPSKLWLGAAIGIMGGITIPSFVLDNIINKRSEEIMFYLPLVIEQIAIGVSSSLDIGPTLQRLVQMADDRDTHNVVTELLKMVETYIRSGVSMEEALNEIGVRSGNNELKHAFMALAQVAKHGGEISHQLHELAGAVATQRETIIEGRIKKLELKATGPVALVFVGFMITLMVGIFIKIGTSGMF